MSSVMGLTVMPVLFMSIKRGTDAGLLFLGIGAHQARSIGVLSQGVQVSG